MPKTVTLVLGSGSARGLAHIGVIHALEERGYAIRSIVGCSIGSVVGGLYAAGQLEAYTAWVLRLDALGCVALPGSFADHSPGHDEGRFDYGEIA